jgi:NAD(P)-dependent dehydrogenase (short-subunit alcohol dehydrogenase family)
VSDRTVLVTGGTGALGTSVTKRLLDDGHRVAATWVVKEEAEALQESVGPAERLMLFETDVTDPASIAGTLEDIEADLGPVDALVHLVGAWKGDESVHDLSLDTWNRMLELNLRSRSCAREQCYRRCVPADGDA